MTHSKHSLQIINSFFTNTKSNYPMKKLYIKRIKLDFFVFDSETIDISVIEQKVKDEYPNHNVTQLNEMTTISGEYLIIAFSITEKIKARGVTVF